MMTLVCSIAAAFQRGRFTQNNPVSETETLSFDRIYDENFTFVWRTVRALGVPPAVVDDAVQEVFIVIHRRLADYQPTASIRSWIFGVVRRVAKDFRRSQERRGTPVEIREEHLDSNIQDPYIFATQTQAFKIIRDFLEQQDEERQLIFVLSELEQMSVPEVASLTQLNVNTVYSRLKVLRQRLSEFVAERTGEDHGELYE